MEDSRESDRGVAGRSRRRRPPHDFDLPGCCSRLACPSKGWPRVSPAKACSWRTPAPDMRRQAGGSWSARSASLTPSTWTKALRCPTPSWPEASSSGNGSATRQRPPATDHLLCMSAAGDCRAAVRLAGRKRVPEPAFPDRGHTSEPRAALSLPFVGAQNDAIGGNKDAL